MLGLLAAIIFSMYLWVGGQVWGEEFSPDDFTRRRFSYNVMPIFGVTIRGVQHYPSTSVFEQTLVADGWIQTRTTNPQTWHLVNDSVSDNDSSDFDADILVGLLNEKDSEGDEIWSQWTDKYPKHAKIFWPAIARLARNDLYWAVPDLMNVAREFEKDGSPLFQRSIDKLVSKSFFDKAEELRETGDSGEAVRYYSEALKLFAAQEAFLGRSAAYAAEGKQSASQSDIENSKESTSSYAE